MAEVALGTTQVVNSNGPLGEVLPTRTWLPPPTDLSYLTPLWNGMLAGISGNAVRFCEPYTPYAWPIAYDVVPADGKPVALGVFGQSLLVLTTGRPVLVQGSAPDAMDQQPLEIPQGCVAPRSAVSMGVRRGVGLRRRPVLVRGRWRSHPDSRDHDPRRLAGAQPVEYRRVHVRRSVLRQLRRRLGPQGLLHRPVCAAGHLFHGRGRDALRHFDELRDQLYVLSSTNVQKWDAGAPLRLRASSPRCSARRDRSTSGAPKWWPTPTP